MRWFRSKLQLGSRLALFALGIQLALSFGHIHLHDFIPDSTRSAAIEAAVASPGENAPGHHPDGSPDTDCAICALLHLASGSPPAEPPALPLPVRTGSTGLWALAEVLAASAPHSLFQARGPPAA
jgi:hypothetical protein